MCARTYYYYILVLSTNSGYGLLIFVNIKKNRGPLT